MKTVESAWQDYVLLTDIGQVTDREHLARYRRAFYAGAVAVWGVLMTADSDPGGEMAVMGRIHGELVAYRAEQPAAVKAKAPRKAARRKRGR